MRIQDCYNASKRVRANTWWNDGIYERRRFKSMYLVTLHGRPLLLLLAGSTISENLDGLVHAFPLTGLVQVCDHAGQDKDQQSKTQTSPSKKNNGIVGERQCFPTTRDTMPLMAKTPNITKESNSRERPRQQLPHNSKTETSIVSKGYKSPQRHPPSASSPINPHPPPLPKPTQLTATQVSPKARNVSSRNPRVHMRAQRPNAASSLPELLQPSALRPVPTGQQRRRVLRAVQAGVSGGTT